LFAARQKFASFDSGEVTDKVGIISFPLVNPDGNGSHREGFQQGRELEIFTSICYGGKNPDRVVANFCGECVSFCPLDVLS
jgi:hypothetical protein